MSRTYTIRIVYWYGEEVVVQGVEDFHITGGCLLVYLSDGDCCCLGYPLHRIRLWTTAKDGHRSLD